MGRLGLGSVAWTKPHLLLMTTGQQVWWSQRAELEAELVVVEVLVAEWCGLARTHLDSLAPSFEDPVMKPAVFFLFCPDLR